MSGNFRKSWKRQESASGSAGPATFKESSAAPTSTFWSASTTTPHATKNYAAEAHSSPGAHRSSCCRCAHSLRFLDRHCAAGPRATAPCHHGVLGLHPVPVSGGTCWVPDRPLRQPLGRRRLSPARHSPAALTVACGRGTGAWWPVSPPAGSRGWERASALPRRGSSPCAWRSPRPGPGPADPRRSTATAGARSTSPTPTRPATSPSTR